MIDLNLLFENLKHVFDEYEVYYYCPPEAATRNSYERTDRYEENSIWKKKSYKMNQLDNFSNEYIISLKRYIYFNQILYISHT